MCHMAWTWTLRCMELSIWTCEFLWKTTPLMEKKICMKLQSYRKDSASMFKPRPTHWLPQRELWEHVLTLFSGMHLNWNAHTHWEQQWLKPVNRNQYTPLSSFSFQTCIPMEYCINYLLDKNVNWENDFNNIQRRHTTQAKLSTAQ